jgi:hypothetical protein
VQNCFAGTENSDIAEMEFWGVNELGEEEKLEGDPIGNPGSYTNGRSLAMDGDRVSYFSAQKGTERLYTQTSRKMHC